MKISVITVVYNNRTTIGDAIESVLSQQVDNLEYIIVDGGSTDGTLEVIEKYSNESIRLISEPDCGIYDAMNKGFGIASGDVVGILNSDDLYSDRYVLRDVIAAFKQNSDVSLIYGNLVYVRRTNIGKVIRRWHSKPYYGGFFDDGNVPPHPTLFARKIVYQQAGLFDLRYQLAADYELMLRIFKKHSFKSMYMDRLMVRMRLGGATNRSLKNIIDGNKEILKSWLDNGMHIPLRLVPMRIIKRISQFFA